MIKGILILFFILFLIVLLFPSVVSAVETNELGGEAVVQNGSFSFGNSDSVKNPERPNEREIEPLPDIVTDLKLLQVFYITTVSIVLIALVIYQNKKKRELFNISLLPETQLSHLQSDCYQGRHWAPHSMIF